MNKQKSKGTAHESQIVKWLRQRLDDDRIERRALHGNKDMGDIYGLYAHGDAEGIIEAKSYKQWGPANMAEWQRQTLEERANADADFALLVVKTPGVGAKSFGRTQTYLTVNDLLVIANIPFVFDSSRAFALSRWVETDLETICCLIEGGHDK